MAAAIMAVSACEVMMMAASDMREPAATPGAATLLMRVELRTAAILSVSLIPGVFLNMPSRSITSRMFSRAISRCSISCTRCDAGSEASPPGSTAAGMSIWITAEAS